MTELNDSGRAASIEVPIKGGAHTHRRNTYGFMDIYDASSNSVWEVKPDNKYWNELSGVGSSQLAHYIYASKNIDNSYGTLRPGFILNDMLIETLPFNSNLQVSIRSGNPFVATRPALAFLETGMVYYKIQQKGDKATEPSEVPSSTKREVDPNATAEAGWRLVGLGGATIVGTIAADFLTGGASLLDDPVTIGFGIELIRRGLELAY